MTGSTEDATDRSSNTQGAVVQWLSQTRNDLCRTIGLAAIDEYDKFLHTCLVQGGLPYIKEQYAVHPLLLYESNSVLRFPPSALPLCMHSSTAQYLQKLALRIHGDDAFTECLLKRSVISDLLKAALSKLDLRVTLRLDPPTKDETSLISSTSSLLATCIDTKCIDVPSALLHKLKQLLSVDPWATPSKAATRIMIPMLLDIHRQLKSWKSPDWSCIQEIQGSACADFMSGIAEEKFSSLSLEPLSGLLKMKGGVDALLTK